MKVYVAVLLLAAAVVVRPVAGEEKTTPAATTSAAPAHDPNEVVARVGTEPITRKELDFAVQGTQMQMSRRGSSVPHDMAPQFEHDVLEELISRQLVLQEGRVHPPADVDDKVTKQLADVQQRFGGEEAMLKALQDTGVTKQEYIRRLRDELIIQTNLDQLIDREAKIKPEDVKNFYDENRDKFKMPETVRASHILIRIPADATDEVKSQKRAQIDAARSLIKGGEKFADIAKKVSEDPGSGAQGGDLGFFQRGQMVPEFEQAAFSLKLNELSDVITTKFGYHVLMVTDRKAAGERSLDEVKDDIGRYLRMGKGREIVQQHVKDLRDKAKVEVLLAQPPAASLAPKPVAPAKPSRPLPTVETPPVAAPTK